MTERKYPIAKRPQFAVPSTVRTGSGHVRGLRAFSSVIRVPVALTLVTRLFPSSQADEVDEAAGQRS
jgi:hypothetical protein